MERKVGGDCYVADAVFPEGLKLLSSSQNYPFVVEVKSSFIFDKMHEILNSLRKSSINATLVYICNEPKESIEQFANSFGVVVLGRAFVRSLMEDNPGEHLNLLLGFPDSTFENRHDGEVYLRSGARREINYFDSNGVRPRLQIKDDDPERISDINENDFKAYLNGNNDGSSCALIIGNGVSIPFGSDGWSDMIEHLVDRLEPFYIERRAHVEKALSNSSYALSSFVKTTLIREESEDSYIDSLRYCIYRKYNGIMHGQQSLVKVIAQAKAKYRALPLLTYNYDTFIERQ